MRNQGQLIRAACSLLFCLFTFYYIYSYQCDLIAYAQMVLSDGKTHFDRTVGALLITVALYVVHLFVYGMVRPHDRYIALTYFPSWLILTVLTDIPNDIANHFSFGAWLWVVPLLLIFFVAVVVFLRQWSARWQSSATSLFHDGWINLATMAAMFFLMGWVSNNDELFHRQLRMERKVIDGNYEAALKEDLRTTKADPAITQLAAFVLSQQQGLGEHFFEYPISLSQNGNNPHSPNTPAQADIQSATQTTFASVDLQSATPARLFFIPNQLIRTVQQSEWCKDDYELTQLLLERRLIDFAKKIKKCYGDSVMPKHYREALAIFRQSIDAKILEQQEEEALKVEMEKAKKERRGKRSSKKDAKKEKTIHPLDSIMSEYYRTYQLLLENSSDKRVVYNLSRKYFSNTYWHYYHFN